MGLSFEQTRRASLDRGVIEIRMQLAQGLLSLAVPSAAVAAQVLPELAEPQLASLTCFRSEYELILPPIEAFDAPPGVWQRQVFD